MIFSIFYWNTFDSGWFWSLLILQCLFHWHHVLGIPAKIINTTEKKILEPYIIVQLKQKALVLDQPQLFLVAFTACLLTIVLILGFWFQIKAFQGFSLLFCLQVFVFFVSYKTSKKILTFDYSFLEIIVLVKKLHRKIKLLSISVILSAMILSFGRLI
jgi:hypothetical protein